MWGHNLRHGQIAGRSIARAISGKSQLNRGFAPEPHQGTLGPLDPFPLAKRRVPRGVAPWWCSGGKASSFHEMHSSESTLTISQCLRAAPLPFSLPRRAGRRAAPAMGREARQGATAGLSRTSRHRARRKKPANEKVSPVPQPPSLAPPGPIAPGDLREPQPFLRVARSTFRASPILASSALRSKGFMM